MQPFWKGFSIGFALATALVIGGILVIGLRSGPMLAVEISLPEYAIAGEPFSITVGATNPHSEKVVLHSVDIPNRFFRHFEVLSVSPAASEDSPVGGFGTQTWYYDLPLEPGGRQTIEFTTRAPQPGTYVVELEVCNAYEDCTGVPRTLEVRVKRG